MKKLLSTTFFLFFAATAHAADIDVAALPDFGTPAQAGDGIVTNDSSAAAGSRASNIHFDATATNCLTGTGTWAAFEIAGAAAAVSALYDTSAELQAIIGASVYQPIESTLTDIADGTIAEDLVNTAYPWADNEVADDITASNYAPLASPALTGIISHTAQVVTVFTEGDLALTSTLGYIVGDNDSDSDTVDLQDGTVVGQSIWLIAYSGVDADDTVTIAMTDTTCTNCPSVVFNSVNDRWLLTWSGSTWMAAKLVNDEGYLTAEVDGSTTNEIEVVDEVFSAANFDGGTASAVSQDDFYDLWHGIDTDDDGDIDVIDATVWATKLSVSGGTLTGELVLDELGIEGQPTDAITDCSTFAATGGGIFYDDSEGVWKKCQDNVLTVMDTTGGTPAFSDISGATNTTAAMLVGTGASLGPTGTGTITATSATLAGTVTVVDSTDTTAYVAIFDDATGSLAPKTDTGLTYNAGTGMLTATGFTGPLTGTASGNLTAEVDGDISNELPIAGFSIDISGSPASTVDFDPTEFIGNRTWAAGADATVAWTWDVSTGTDPVITFGNNYVNVSTGALQVGGVAVGAPTEGTYTDVSGTAVSVDTTETDDITWGAAAGTTQTWTWDTGAGTDPNMLVADDSFTFNKTLVTSGGVEVSGDGYGGQYTYFLEDTDLGTSSSGFGIYGDLAHSTIFAIPLAAPTAGQVMAYAVPGDQTMKGNVTRSVSVGTWITPLTAEVDGSTTNEIEVVDEAFSAANFDGGTTSGVSQDDFYDLWHGIDTDDDGDIDVIDATVWATKLGNIVEDTTPQLGGNLDLNTHEIIVKDAEWLPIEWAEGGSVAPAAAAAVTGTTRKVGRAFDGAANEDVTFIWQVPDDFTGSTITAQVTGVVSSATAPADTEVVAFSVALACYANSEASTLAVGTAQTSSLTADATYVQYDNLDTAYSSAITPAGSIAAGEECAIALIRLATTTDTYAQDFNVTGVNVKFSRALTND